LRIAIGEAAYQAAMRRFLSGVGLADDVVYPGAQPSRPVDAQDIEQALKK
jgi:hypothetical protein